MKIIIAGAGEVGSHLAKMLSSEANDLTIIDCDQSRLDALDISNAVSVDMKAYTQPGTYNVPVDIVLPDGITLTSEVTVQLTLEEKPANNTDNPGTDEPSGEAGTENPSDQ